MLRNTVAYAAALVVFLGLDAAYLSTIGGKLFKQTLGDVLTPSFSIPPAVLFYAIYPLGIVIFALLPAFATGRWTTALGYGALLGFFAYFTYDMTNWATIRNWNATISLVDLTWGTLLNAATATAAFFIVRSTVGIE